MILFGMRFQVGLAANEPMLFRAYLVRALNGSCSPVPSIPRIKEYFSQVENHFRVLDLKRGFYVFKSAGPCSFASARKEATALDNFINVFAIAWFCVSSR